MAYVRIATPEEVGGALGKRWREALDKDDRVANINTSSSLRPALVETFFAHYRNLMNSPDSGLTPAERQMVATVTANAFRCQYWTLAHAEFLRRDSGDEELASQFRANWRSAKLTEKQYGMLEYAELLALEPSSITEVHVEALREVGWRDEDIIDIVHIVGVFSYLVRMADGLGIAIEPDWATYKDELTFKEQVAEKPIANELKQAVKAKATNS